MTYGSAPMLTLLEYIKWCHVGFGRTESTLVLVYVWIGMCHYLVYDARWHHRICTLACYSNTSQWQWQWHTHCTAVDVGWMHGTVSRWLWTYSLYVVLVHVWIWMCHCLVYDALSQLAAVQSQLQWYKIYDCAPMLMLIEYIEWCRVG